MQDFRNLQVWEKALRLTLDVYAASHGFPKEEMYGLTSQVRRAAASIGANIAEGCCRKGDVELGRFLQIAMGSAVKWSITVCWRVISSFFKPQNMSALPVK